MSWQKKIASKIGNLDELSLTVQQWKKDGNTVVFTNGCFDILHRGHIDYLSKAADLGDHLVIGLNSDSSVSKLKGKERPIIDQNSRALKLAALAFVSAVIIFDDETPIQLIQQLQPQVLAKGGDYTIDTIVGAKEVLANNGKVEVIPFLDGYSSSAIIDKIKNEES